MAWEGLLGPVHAARNSKSAAMLLEKRRGHGPLSRQGCAQLYLAAGMCAALSREGCAAATFGRTAPRLLYRQRRGYYLGRAARSYYLGRAALRLHFA